MSVSVQEVSECVYIPKRWTDKLQIRKNVQFYFAILRLMQTVLSVYILVFNLVTHKQKWSITANITSDSRHNYTSVHKVQWGSPKGAGLTKTTPQTHPLLPNPFFFSLSLVALMLLPEPPGAHPENRSRHRKRRLPHPERFPSLLDTNSIIVLLRPLNHPSLHRQSIPFTSPYIHDKQMQQT